MLMNFSRIDMPLPEPYISQDEIDMLVEMDRIDGIKHKLSEYERRFLNDTALSELCSSANESLSKQF